MRYLFVCFVFVLNISFFSCTDAKHNGALKRINTLSTVDSLVQVWSDEKAVSENPASIADEIARFPQDSASLRALEILSKHYSQISDSIRLQITIKERKKRAKRLNDTPGLAKIDWDLAYFFHTHTRHLDSAYFYYTQAEKKYLALNDNRNLARVLINISTIQLSIKDYLGSEVTSYQVLELLGKQQRPNVLHTYRAYNNLGVALKELKDFDKSLLFFERAEKELRQRPTDGNTLVLWNNMGSVLSELKKFDEAEVYFNKALQEEFELEQENPFLYVVVLNNISGSRIEKQDTLGVNALLDMALESALRHDNKDAFTLSQISLAKLSLLQHDTVAAVQHTIKAKESAALQQDNRSLLFSLSQLIQLDEQNARKHAQEYIRLDDSLQHRDRLTQNKFAGIRFETNAYRAQTERLSNRLLWVAGTASGIVIGLGMLFVIFRQRSRNKELVLTQQKHEADQQIYKLVMKQQRKYEEGRELEKKRIARELHDGILGKLFGLQLNLEMLNAKTDAESEEKRWEYIDQIRKVSQEIRSLSHDLNRIEPNPSDYVSVLKDYVEKQESNQTKFELSIDDQIAFETVDTEIRVNLFRIIQEAIQNIHKHAQATQVWIHLERDDDFLELSIEDNGKGIGKKIKPGIGINNMKSRAREMNGKLNISFQSGKGTQITLKIRY